MSQTVFLPTPERKVFLSTWKDIPPTNEFNSRVSCGIELKKAKERLEANNVFLIAERKVDIGDSSQVCINKTPLPAVISCIHVYSQCFYDCKI